MQTSYFKRALHVILTVRKNWYNNATTARTSMYLPKMLIGNMIQRIKEMRSFGNLSQSENGIGMLIAIHYKDAEDLRFVEQNNTMWVEVVIECTHSARFTSQLASELTPPWIYCWHIKEVSFIICHRHQTKSLWNWPTNWQRWTTSSLSNCLSRSFNKL